MREGQSRNERGSNHLLRFPPFFSSVFICGYFSSPLGESRRPWRLGVSSRAMNRSLLTRRRTAVGVGGDAAFRAPDEVGELAAERVVAGLLCDQLQCLRVAVLTAEEDV